MSKVKGTSTSRPIDAASEVAARLHAHAWLSEIHAVMCTRRNFDISSVAHAMRLQSYLEVFSRLPEAAASASEVVQRIQAHRRSSLVVLYKICLVEISAASMPDFPASPCGLRGRSEELRTGIERPLQPPQVCLIMFCVIPLL